jgi:hypothetical protein
MSILHGVDEYDRGYVEEYFYSYALATPFSQKAGYIYNPVVPKGWGHLLLQKINLGSFLLSLAEFLASSPYSILTLQVTSLFFPGNFLPLLPSLAQLRFFVLRTTSFAGRCASPSSTSFRERILRMDLQDPPPCKAIVNRELHSQFSNTHLDLSFNVCYALQLLLHNILASAPISSHLDRR